MKISHKFSHEWDIHSHDKFEVCIGMIIKGVKLQEMAEKGTWDYY